MDPVALGGLLIAALVGSVVALRLRPIIARSALLNYRGAFVRAEPADAPHADAAAVLERTAWFWVEVGSDRWQVRPAGDDPLDGRPELPSLARTDARGRTVRVYLGPAAADDGPEAWIVEAAGRHGPYRGAADAASQPTAAILRSAFGATRALASAWPARGTAGHR